MAIGLLKYLYKISKYECTWNAVKQYQIWPLDNFIKRYYISLLFLNFLEYKNIFIDK